MPLVMNGLILTQLSPRVLSFIYTSVVASLTLFGTDFHPISFFVAESFFLNTDLIMISPHHPIFSPPKNPSTDKDQNPEYAFRIKMKILNMPYEALHSLM